MFQLPLFTWEAPQVSFLGGSVLEYKVWVEFQDQSARKVICWQEMTLKQYIERWGGDYAAS